jgi:hypothetical protein
MKNCFISFDIDGTLIVNSSGIKQHHLPFIEVLSKHYDQCTEPVSFLNTSIDGWMDNKILKEND